MKLLDAQTLTTASLDADICIVGAGPAGLTLAREFAGTGIRVCLLESGGFKKRRDTQKLNNAEAEGTPYQNARHTRSRQVGGTANRWNIQIGPGVTGVRMAAYDPIDFEQRDWLTESHWCLKYEALEPYYDRAQVALHLGAFDYSATPRESAQQPRLPLDPDMIESGIYQFPPSAVFTAPQHDPHDVLSTSQTDNVTLVYNTTVQEVETQPDGTTVTGVRAITYNQKPFRVHASKVILAIGGIETVRLLLLSNGAGKHQNGLGNDYDQLGRYFMDHPQAHFGIVTPTNREIFDKTDFYDLQWNPQGSYATMGMLKLGAAAQRREKLPNFAFMLFPRRKAHLTKTFQAYRTYTEALRYRYIPPHPVQNFAEMLRHAATTARLAENTLHGTHHYYGLAHGGWSKLPQKSRIFDVFEVITLVEQLPHAENRISLGESVDDYGQRRAKIHWHWTSEDTQHVKRAHALFAGEMERAGIGEARFPDEPYHVPGSHHHIGGARMSVDPRNGVVDPDGKVHGVEGLYAASSATFPTGGYANPTLTIVALAIRLADHLKQAAAKN